MLAIALLALSQNPPRITGFEVAMRPLIETAAKSLRCAEAGSSLEFPPLEQGFREALVSWNADCPEGASFCVELRVRAGHESEWSPWLYVGDWGTLPALEKRIECEQGRIATDFFQSSKRLASIQARVRAFGKQGEIGLHRLDLTLRDREMFPEPERSPEPGPALERLPVPFRSQKVERREIAGRICSPTSVSMVLAYRGVDLPTAAVAERVYDAPHDMYGNWPRNVQAAYSLGVPGFVTAFADWSLVRASIARKEPLVISIAVKDGALTGAPYKNTDGHLIVLCGFDEHGDCLVNDPAAPDAASGMRTYKRAELERCWMSRGGTAYVLLPRAQ